ncbi:MAG: putative DNA-binding domain-containing protein, partial [Methylobacter sp.]
MHSNPLETGMRVDFKAKQLEFAAYIRDPENNPPPADVKQQRMAMYRELFFNNLDSFLSANFPVLRTLLNDRQWFELGQDFYARHASQSPHFSQIPEEFLDYLQNERDTSADFPFMLELAHYE